MKFVAFLAVLFVFVNLAEQIPQLVNCPPGNPAHRSTKCGRIDCEGRTDSWSGVMCGTYQCAPGKQIGYRQMDDSKVYPECCGRPICAD